MSDDMIVEESCGNVFADLGYPNAGEALVKSRLAQRITAVIEERNLTQVQAAAILDIDLSKLSKLSRGKLREFSIDYLSHFLAILNQNYEINTNNNGTVHKRSYLMLERVKEIFCYPIVRRQLNEINLKDSNLSEADLRNADLCGADLRGANLTRTDLNGVDLSEADLRGADLNGASISRADLYRADLRGADLRGADLRGSNLSRADLREADLRGVDLSRANLRAVNLIEANLSQANLSRADLSRANLSQTDLSQATVFRTRFINSEGISDSLKCVLIERGAIFDNSPNDRSPILV
jgi:uncharacterized protein YjbI with pentapeptide repeats